MESSFGDERTRLFEQTAQDGAETTASTNNPAASSSLSYSSKLKLSRSFNDRDKQGYPSRLVTHNSKRNSTTNVLESVHKPIMPSFWEFLRGEIVNDEFDDLSTIKRERVAALLQIPYQLEKFIFFGGFVCLDVFLSLFTLLPIRFLIAIFSVFQRIFGWRERVRAAHICDLLKGVIFLTSCIAIHYIDGSRMYHNIRGQTTLKLYVIYNVLEVVDRLCCAFGQDVLDSFFSKATVSASTKASLHPLPHFLMALGYIFLHTIVIFFQLVTLNVAINSFSASLLTVLLSNQFGEIKSNVFKKVTKENLWQVACSDVVERFQLMSFLLLIFVRNWSEMRESFDYHYVVENFVPQLLALFGSELLIDWLKHAFISKFNCLEPSTYGTFLDILCRDLVMQKSSRISYDQTPAVARRIGFAAIPLACVFVRVTTETASSFEFSFTLSWCIVAVLVYLCLLVAKLVIGIMLLGIASAHCLHVDVFNPEEYSNKYAFANDLVDRFTQLKR